MQTDSGTIERLLLMMTQLRDPEHGCAWDKMQSFATIAPYTLEETYEVLDAIERQDFAALKEELGDLLFHIVFYAQIAKEQALFDFNEICQIVSQKLISRHPHIFAGQSFAKSDKANYDWEKNKVKERAAKNQHSILDDIPPVLPALMKANKMQKRCATVGFDWDKFAPVLAKVHEEIEEVLAEINKPTPIPSRIEEEIGDLLFAVVNLSRHLGHEPELALQKACGKFEGRFRQVEKLILNKGGSLENATLDEMEKLWQQIKKE
ncbi:nucleoside triphosphate pyrophosphohydrolase [Arsenophonus nasoniae]|uniref:Nucleoside triphosphate pyrophosphohydrolase n=1 Tax=Arsenophonus nasoniae TaxID=638 RepID=D2U411_9GAMM|nr:nucleoside triphosphate pyrophosphohydrolase [Arsenophonus nasoniae]QBY45065.1 Nucleoside triphosphate pyrophosphohydrolase [Arsenophonus nasoniae]WGM02243.1 nucleoside triphosphate pyrophosphohydrolase [Arsenophonus nasoniae]WGM05280.1 nucleoside triphosphate pyrophosphohydrolase [Arsenophonus nasoniae]WGM10290.1 nucleoside triphosphate pyrophosphohydrolase [Arsenophonus nasoniae]WGM15005.1 nucleoside triphosphate pyrophosphohydrolase [Arsenophonus nasoniae]